MTTFTYYPDYGASLQQTPRVRTVRFGDGYEQRLSYGINNNLQVWQLQFASRTNAEIQAILAFLDARGGTESFDWTTPNGLAGRQWVCRQWTQTITAFNINAVQATFEEVAEP